MKFSEVKNDTDLSKFTSKNKNNFSLSIKNCIMSENDKAINWFVELSISDLKDEIQIAGCNLHNIDYELYILFRKARKLTVGTGIYTHFMMLIDIDLIANVQEDLIKKIANYKKTKKFLKAKEDYFISSMQNNIEIEFNLRSKQLKKFGYTEDKLEDLFKKLVSRIRMKKVLE